MSNDSIARPFDRGPSRGLGAGGPRFDELEKVAQQEAEDSRRLRWMILGAAAFHALLLIVALPRGHTLEPSAPRNDQLFVVQTVKLAPPPAAPQKAIPKPKKKRIPMPDPTPDEPEPLIEELEIDVPDIAPVGDVDLPFSIPDAPVLARGPGGSGSDPILQVGEGVSAPRKIHYPNPPYTEPARAARIQGVVILQAIIDAAGRVADVKVLKGLPEGLDKSALETIQTWTFEPAMRAGLPVAVYFNLTVRFSLQ